MKTSLYIRVRVKWQMQTLLLILCIPFLFMMTITTYALIIGPSISKGMGFLIAGVTYWYLFSLATSYIDVSEEEILVKVPQGRFSMRWGEVQKIITNGELFAFQGGIKQLSVSIMFAGKGKYPFRETLEKQIQEFQISVEHIDEVPLLHKNTRI